MLQDALTSRLCITGDMPEVPPQVEVPVKAILDQICKMGITNHQDLTALSWSLKGFGTNFLSYELWLLMPASRAGEWEVVSTA